MIAQKDIKWKKALEGEDRDKAIASFHAERDSLLDNVLVLIDEDHPQYATAIEQACPGRYLLDEKRSGMWKTPGVKQGFKENKLLADGPGFVYYSHVVKLYTVRISLFRPNRGTRRVAIQAVMTAFLQSDGFPSDVVKYLKMYNPIASKLEYFRQVGPLLGCMERTLLQCVGRTPMLRILRVRGIFVETMRDRHFITRSVIFSTCHMWMITSWMERRIPFSGHLSALLEDRFDCKELEWLEPNATPLDYLGMELTMDTLRTYIGMEAYITNCLEVLGWENCKPARTPMDRHIDSDSPALSPDKVTKFFTANGFLGWLSSTNRPDITHTFSRIGQHQAAPTESAYAALYHAFCYLSATRRYRLSAPLYQSDQPLDRLAVFAENKDAFAHWEFYCDPDFVGNIEAQNKRRSQNGYIALLNGATVYWVSKVASVAFACEDIGESHADVSSGAAEVYCAGNATMDFLHLSYVAAEMNIPFPKPFRLKMDNAAAQCFAEDSCFKSELKHIDCRQEWVKILRDRDICIPVHVDTRDNLADIFTKILPVQVFERFRNRLMFNPDG